jgi:hypothetical protein
VGPKAPPFPEPAGVNAAVFITQRLLLSVGLPYRFEALGPLMTGPDERMLFVGLGPLMVGAQTRELSELAYMTGPLWYTACCLPTLVLVVVLVVVLVLMAGRVVGVPVLLANMFVARCCPCCLDGPA